MTTMTTRDTSLLKDAIAKALSVLICTRDEHTADAESSPEYGTLVITGEGATMFGGFVSLESARDAVNEARAALAEVYSVHEAGHAVIAAHFRIPFNYVVAGSLGHVEAPAPYLVLQNAASWLDARDFMRQYAVMLCASRAAVDEILPGQGKEWHYKGDENSKGDENGVEEIASELGIKRSKFSTWRDVVLSEARRPTTREKLPDAPSNDGVPGGWECDL